MPRHFKKATTFYLDEISTRRSRKRFIPNTNNLPHNSQKKNAYYYLTFAATGIAFWEFGNYLLDKYQLSTAIPSPEERDFASKKIQSQGKLPSEEGIKALVVNERKRSRDEAAIFAKYLWRNSYEIEVEAVDKQTASATSSSEALVPPRGGEKLSSMLPEVVTLSSDPGTESSYMGRKTSKD